MIDHIGLTVSDIEKSKAFYTRALAPMGFQLLTEIPVSLSGSKDFAGFGEPPKPEFWISSGTPNTPAVHVAFRASTRAQVDAFYAAALSAGGRDNGAPGIRQHYHPNYYGAFILDPDGHNIEVVCHAPESC
jgi:catechol 2,3-dioxygenase-like lactoylglutathione lyase family enzyme